MPMPRQLLVSEALQKGRASKGDWLRTPAHTAAYLSRGRWLPTPHLNLVAEEVAKMRDGPVFLIVTLPPRHGKLIAHETPILTPTGWTTHGELRNGDTVFGRDGQPVKVIALSEETTAEYLLTFSDGTTIQAHACHEWPVYDRGQAKWRVMKSEQIASRQLDTGTPGKRGHRYMLQVDAPGPVEFPQQSLLIHPYVLGAWLGDGSTKKSCITYGEQKRPIIDKWRRLGYSPTSHNVHPLTGVFTDYVHSLYGGLKAIGVLGHKHIPSRYLFASKEQRLELLAGLIDTDGHCENSTGRMRIVTTLSEMVKGISFLVRSLGMNPYVTSQPPALSSSGIQGRLTVYTVGFNCTYPLPTVMPNKRPTRYVKPQRRAITAIRRVEGKPGRCIQVEGSIYLAGTGMVPTCNSELISHWTPVWFLKNWPFKQIILSSYQIGFASEWGAKAKNSLIEHEPDLGLSLMTDTKAKARWSIQGYGGGMVSTGIGGALTGRGGDLIIIDDPIRSQQEALSPTYRNTAKEWYKATLRTRLQPGGSIIILMTRWHEDDLVGWLLSENPEGLEHRDPWKVINLPAIAQDDDPLGRPEGKALWPVMYDLDALLDLRQATGSYWWSAEYMGSPKPEGGGIIHEEWFQYYGEGTGIDDPLDVEDDDLKNELRPRRVRQFWDTAFKESQANDRSACVTILDCQRGYFIPDVWAKRVEFPELQVGLKAKYSQFVPDRIEVEDKASGISLIQQIRRDTQIPIRAIKSQGDKVSRMHSISAIVEAGLVYLPARAPWLSEFLHEVCSFPAAAHDDIADAFAYSLLALKPRRDREKHPVTRKRKKQSKWKD